MLKRFFIFSLYFFYVLVLIFIFAHILFPEKKGAYLAGSIVKNNFNLDFYCEKIELNFPLKLTIINPELSGKEIKNLKLSKIEAKLNILSFFTGKLSFDINGQGYNGSLKSKLSFGIFNPSENIKSSISVNNIDLKSLGNCFESGIDFEGLASGKINFKLKKEKGVFSCYADLNNFNAVSDFIIIPLSSIGLNRCEISGNFIKNNIKIDNSSINTKAGLASFSGSMNFLIPIIRSSINFDGKFVPDVAYLGKNKSDPALSMLFSVLKSQKNIQYSLTGRILNPRIRLK